MDVKDTFFSRKSSLNCNGRIISLDVPKIMGILNVTPDSFYDGGRYTTEYQILIHVEQMLSEGADFIDIGAYSSRPGATHITPEEEISRLKDPLTYIRNKFPDSVLSVDTFHAQVARFAVENFGVDMINDISAGEPEGEKMPETVANLGIPYIIMHMKGTPQNMQNKPVYGDVVKEIIQFFADKVNALRHMGIRDLVIDPGFGFGKTIEHNFMILNQFDAFKLFELPLMVGLSRKSTIYKTLNISADEALNGTTVLNTVALMKGADILRVHDVKEARQAIILVERIRHEITGNQ